MPQKAESPGDRHQMGSNWICLPTNRCVPRGHEGPGTPECAEEKNKNNYVHVYTAGPGVSMLGAEL